jgi:predicted MPP superfamily phosphohydrolase
MLMRIYIFPNKRFFSVTREQIRELLNEVEKRFAEEANLIQLESGKVIFVGDTHGDLEATEIITHRYLNSENKLVFLGDYVDRGPDSLENINFLLGRKLERPNSLYLLMGNHEGLDDELRRRYGEVLSSLPLAASTPNGIIALHGALPDVLRLEDIDRIKPGSVEWHQITWGDWQEGEGGNLGFDPYTGRPQFGRGWFEEIMSRMDKSVLIRSHQPSAPPTMYNKRCLTIFTSSAYTHYVPARTIALVDLRKVIKGADDIEIETV